MAEPIILFAHGAGAPPASAWMQAWKKRLATIGPTTTFEYAYMANKRKRPDPPAVLIATHRQALAAAKEKAAKGSRVVLAGKSMGSRIGCHVALEEEVDALVCFGYPLVGQARKDGSRSVRDEVLLALRTPILFIQGTRDSLCPLDELAKVRAKMNAKNELHVVDTGDHSLQVTKGSGLDQNAVDEEILRVVKDFLG